ncbi:MAG: glycosyltransferase family 39 protein [Candidatus Eiseniibacteriota bacterium]|nr:MAG: glycosyltransferase family 39 protein [Candidatus Eisenbacteria bacterium]
MFWSRFQALLLWGVLGFAVFAWSRQLFGWRGGYFSLLLYVFSPNLFAHGRLAATEMPFACLAFVPAYFFWKLLERPCASNVVLSGVFLGLALSAKYSGLIFIISFVLSAGVSSRADRPPRRRRSSSAFPWFPCCGARASCGSISASDTSSSFSRSYTCYWDTLHRR